MRATTLAIILAYLACTGRGRKVQQTSEEMKGSSHPEQRKLLHSHSRTGQASPSETLVKFLRSLNPATGFQAGAGRHVLSPLRVAPGIAAKNMHSFRTSTRDRISSRLKSHVHLMAAAHNSSSESLDGLELLNVLISDDPSPQTQEEDEQRAASAEALEGTAVPEPAEASTRVAAEKESTAPEQEALVSQEEATPTSSSDTQPETVSPAVVESLPETHVPTPVAEDQEIVSTPLLHRPLPQAVLCLAGYLVHVCVLSRYGVKIPGSGASLGWDTCAGLAVLVAAARQRMSKARTAVPRWLVKGKVSSPEELEPEEAVVADISTQPGRVRAKYFVTCFLLLAAPMFISPLLAPMMMSLISGLQLENPCKMFGVRLFVEQVVFNLILGAIVKLRHPEFFSKLFVRWKWKAPWLAPVLGGYAASLALFNLVEPINQALLPSLFYEPEGLVANLANPVDRQVSSLALGAIAPVLGAPLFEELQSRAFILQALTGVMPLRNAILVQGFLFGAQHMQIGLVLPLAVTGFFWGVLYVNSGNLLVPIMIHGLWNLRIFLGSYLGL